MKNTLDYISLSEVTEIVAELEKVTAADRRKFFEDPDTFFIWWFYYYPESFRSDLAVFHFEWMYYFACTDMHILDEGFRGSLKTELTKIYVIRSICYKLWNYIVVQSYNSDSSDDMVINISKMLTKQSLVADYGNLYPFSTKKEDFAKAGRTHFDTTNGVKVKARALLENLRGSNTYDEEDGTSRPDLLILDDIDTTDSVRNVEIIDKNENKLRQETIGAMSKEKQRIIFLGNTIGNDGIVRRFAEAIKTEITRWVYLWQPLFDEKGKCVWSEFFTQDAIENIKSTEAESWDQNYLLIPKMTIGLPVFDISQIKRVVRPYKIIEGFHLYQPPQDQLVIGVDVAEGGIKSDNSTLKARNRKGETVFELADRLDEVKLAEKLNWILTEYSEGEGNKKKKYLGTILIERNVGKAFINQCIKTRDNGSFVYPWVNYVLKARKIDGTIDDDDLIEKYGFNTNGPSKNLIIAEYKNALYADEIDVSYDTYIEICTYIRDKKNAANAAYPNKDDRIIGDMIAYWGILHEPFIALYDAVQVDLDELTPVQRHLHRLRNPDSYHDELE